LFNENKELTAEVDQLREKRGQKEHEKTGKLSSHNSPSTEKCCEYILLY
jgi:hypothetical protein